MAVRARLSCMFPTGYGGRAVPLVLNMHGSGSSALGQEHLTGNLASDASTMFAAVAPVSGLRRPALCAPTRKVSVLSFHGTADPVDPYQGHGQAYLDRQRPASRASAGGAERLRRGAPSSSEPAPGAVLTTYVACLQSSAVELYTLAGEGHEWPGGRRSVPRVTRLLGPRSTA